MKNFLFEKKEKMEKITCVRITPNDYIPTHYHESYPAGLGLTSREDSDMFYACHNNDFVKVESLLKKGNRYVNALWYAVHFCSDDVIATLVAHGYEYTQELKDHRKSIVDGRIRNVMNARRIRDGESIEGDDGGPHPRDTRDVCFSCGLLDYQIHCDDRGGLYCEACTNNVPSDFKDSYNANAVQGNEEEE